MNQIMVDFSQVTGKIKPVHGVCCAPYDDSMGAKQSLIENYFTQGNIPYCRLHDCASEVYDLKVQCGRWNCLLITIGSDGTLLEKIACYECSVIKR